MSDMNDMNDDKITDAPLSDAVHKMTPKQRAEMAARLMGFGGLFPFVFLALASVIGLRTPFAPAPALLIGYGAIILSFVGALHWGAQLTQTDSAKLRASSYIWSIFPALLAWLALMLPAIPAASCLIVGLLVCWGVDMVAIKKQQWPSFMRALRTILTAIACLSLSVIYLPLFG